MEKTHGIIASRTYFKEEAFMNDFKEMVNNPDFTLLGRYNKTEDADEELQYQGFTLGEISIMSISHYGNVIETLEALDGTYWVFVGAR